MEVMRTRSTVTVACHCCRRCHSSSSSSLPSTNRSSSSISLQSVFQMFSILLLATTTIFSSFSSVLAFNLDTRIPIYKFGPRDSYFGYSVAEHIIKNRDSSRQSEPVLLVGAPQAEPFHLGRTGALYKCPLNTYSTDCDLLNVEPSNNTIDVDRNDQWLGVTVKSQGEGGYVMVCAHRFVRKGPGFRWGNGICYSLTQYLDYSRSFDPCRNRPVALAHEQFGFCQAGVSGDISENFEIIIGSPGPYTWRGTIFTNNIRHSIYDDKTWYMGPVIENESPVKKYSYLGMSVAAGDFLENNIMIFAGGAPRSNGTGQVILYSKDSSGNNLFDLRAIIQGEQFASSFGYSMTVLDCDGDRHADLVVGAPFFYTRTEGGAVYVYLNKDLRLGKFDNNLKLTGKPESRFGFALANASDLNKDGFEDLAVGAPYEDSGVVYIYLGSKTGLKSEPSQRITAINLPSPLNTIRTFGYSLSGNLDLDRNTYPDLLVGAYESDAVVLLRSRPIIKIKTSVKGNLTKIDPNSIGCSDDPFSKTACFSVEPCFRLLSNSIDPHLSGLSLNYRIEAETYDGKKKYYRVVFKRSRDTDTPQIVEKTISLGYSTEYCTKEVIYVKTKQDILTPINFKLSYSLIQDEPRLPREGQQLPNINDYPILDQEEAQRIFTAQFIKDCGLDDVCNSKLRLTAHIHNATKKTPSNYSLVMTDDNILVDVTLVNKGEPAYDTMIVIEHSESLSFVSRKLFSDNDQVDCGLDGRTTIKCSLSNPFNRGRIHFQIRLSGTNIQDNEKGFFVNIQANTTSEDDDLNDNQVELSTEILRKAELELSGLSQPSEVRFGGDVVGESAMKYENDIGPKVYHKYLVKNHGPWRVHRVLVSIHWPIQLENGRDFGKWILYITDKPVVIGNGYCDLNQRFNVQDEDNRYSVKRFKRGAIFRTEREPDGNVKEIATLSCDNGARCVKFDCVINNLTANKTAVIQIPSRLWNATFVEEFPHLHRVSIYSFGRIILNPALNIVQSNKNDKFTIETKAYPDTTHLATRVSFWWYVVAVLIGLILLFFIVFLLVKLGFFKRNRNRDSGYNPVDTNDSDQNGR